MTRVDQGFEASEARLVPGEEPGALTLRASSRSVRPLTAASARPITTLSEGIGEALRRRREALGIPVKFLAASLRRECSHIRLVEKGQHSHTIATLQEFAHHLDCSVWGIVRTGELIYQRSRRERGLT